MTLVEKFQTRGTAGRRKKGGTRRRIMTAHWPYCTSLRAAVVRKRGIDGVLCCSVAGCIGPGVQMGVGGVADQKSKNQPPCGPPRRRRRCCHSHRSAMMTSVAHLSQSLMFEAHVRVHCLSNTSLSLLLRPPLTLAPPLLGRSGYPYRHSIIKPIPIHLISNLNMNSS